MSPSSASQPPSASTATSPSEGIVWSSDCRRAWIRTSRSREPNSALGLVGEVVEPPLLLAEALHDPDAGDGLLDDGRDLTRELLGLPARGEDRGAEAQGGPEQRGGDEQHHQGEHRREGRHDHDRDHEHQHVADDDREELQQSLDQHDVGVRAADELAGLHLVVAREVEPLELAEDRGAEVVLHRERDAATAEAADVREPEPDHAEDDEQQQPRPQRSRWSARTSSTITFCISGAKAEIAVPPIATRERGDRVRACAASSSRSAAGSSLGCPRSAHRAGPFRPRFVGPVGCEASSLPRCSGSSSGLAHRDRAWSRSKRRARISSRTWSSPANERVRGRRPHRAAGRAARPSRPRRCRAPRCPPW